MNNIKLLICLVFVFAAVPLVAKAGQGSGFFEALYDVPVMEGLEELKDEAVLFDKPDGKIASVMAASKSLKAGQIKAFYAQTLAQMGWKKIKDNQYIRQKERLTLDVSTRQSLTIVQFTLSPVR